MYKMSSHFTVKSKYVNLEFFSFWLIIFVIVAQVSHFTQLLLISFFTKKYRVRFGRFYFRFAKQELQENIFSVWSVRDIIRYPSSNFLESRHLYRSLQIIRLI